MINTVHFIHRQGVAHQKINLKNFRINWAGNVYLWDFRSALQFSEVKLLSLETKSVPRNVYADV